MRQAGQRHRRQSGRGRAARPACRRPALRESAPAGACRLAASSSWMRSPNASLSAVASALRRAAYSVRMRRIWRAKWPSCRNAAVDRLLQHRLAALLLPAGAAERIGQFVRHDQVAQPQAGKQHLAEAAGVQHALRPIEALQRRQRMAGVAELAVVIVFQHPGAGLCRPGQQRQSALQRQGDAERALVGRRHHGQAGAWGGDLARGDAQALAVHPHRHQPRAGGFQALAGEEIAGVFHPNRIARPHQHLRHQAQRPLKAAGDQHLFR